MGLPGYLLSEKKPAGDVDPAVFGLEVLALRTAATARPANHPDHRLQAVLHWAQVHAEGKVHLFRLSCKKPQKRPPFWTSPDLSRCELNEPFPNPLYPGHLGHQLRPGRERKPERILPRWSVQVGSDYVVHLSL